MVARVAESAASGPAALTTRGGAGLASSSQRVACALSSWPGCDAGGGLLQSQNSPGVYLAVHAQAGLSHTLGGDAGFQVGGSCARGLASYRGPVMFWDGLSVVC